jgi:hypothetical protein
VKRNPAHRNFSAACERDIQQLGAGFGVLEKHFVKVAEPKEQDCLARQFAFDAAILRHHRRQLRILAHEKQLRRKIVAKTRKKKVSAGICLASPGLGA